METKNIKIAIVGSMFWQEITENLEKNCIKTLKEKSVMDENIHIVHVPGALEIPLAVQILAQKKMYNAIITFGAIVKGDTYHFEQVANECVRGCMDVSRQYNVPVIYEVLAVYKVEDAATRATSKDKNKGVEAALTALEMAGIMEKLQ